MKLFIIYSLVLLIVITPAYGQLSDATGLINRLNIETSGHNFEVILTSNFDLIDYDFDKNKKLNFSNEIKNDLEDKDLSTMIGHLGFGIIERYKQNKKKLIVLSCDNLSENGKILQNLIKEFIEKKYHQIVIEQYFHHLYLHLHFIF